MIDMYGTSHSRGSTRLPPPKAETSFFRKSDFAFTKPKGATLPIKPSYIYYTPIDRKCQAWYLSLLC